MSRPGTEEMTSAMSAQHNDASSIRTQLHQMQQALEMERHRAFLEKSELERDLRWALERMPQQNAEAPVKNAETIMLLDQMEADMRRDRVRVEEMKQQFAAEQRRHADELALAHQENSILKAQLQDCRSREMQHSGQAMRTAMGTAINSQNDHELRFELEFTHKELHRITQAHRQLLVEHKALQEAHQRAVSQLEQLQRLPPLLHRSPSPFRSRSPSPLMVRPQSPVLLRPLSPEELHHQEVFLGRVSPPPPPFFAPPPLQPELFMAPEPLYYPPRPPTPPVEEKKETEFSEQNMMRCLKHWRYRMVGNAVRRWREDRVAAAAMMKALKVLAHWRNRRLARSWESWKLLLQEMAIAAGVAFWVRSQHGKLFDRLQDKLLMSKYETKLYVQNFEELSRRRKFVCLAKIRRYTHMQKARGEVRGNRGDMKRAVKSNQVLVDDPRKARRRSLVEEARNSNAKKFGQNAAAKRMSYQSFSDYVSTKGDDDDSSSMRKRSDSFKKPEKPNQAMHQQSSGTPTSTRSSTTPTSTRKRMEGTGASAGSHKGSRRSPLNTPESRWFGN